jgi:hypothetical protein
MHIVLNINFLTTFSRHCSCVHLKTNIKKLEYHFTDLEAKIEQCIPENVIIPANYR